MNTIATSKWRLIEKFESKIKAETKKESNDWMVEEYPKHIMRKTSLHTSEEMQFNLKDWEPRVLTLRRKKKMIQDSNIH
jgi:pantothenate kinase-related protein Tda10